MHQRKRSYLELPRERAPLDYLWRVTSHGEDRQAPGEPYWHENSPRTPTDIVVFQFTVGGELTYRDKTGTHPVPQGHALMFTYGENTGYGLSPDATETYGSRYVCLSGAGLMEHWNAMRRAYGSIIDLRRDRSVLRTLSHLIDMARPHRAANALVQASAVDDFVMQILNHARARYTETLNPVERAVAALRNTPLTAVSLKETAATYGVSREHLSRVFRDTTGQTPAHYIRRARLERARWLIENTTLPIAQVARQAGYPSLHTLARQLKAATALSPRALRAASTTGT